MPPPKTEPMATRQPPFRFIYEALRASIHEIRHLSTFSDEVFWAN
jgi:hypothetical protein